MGTSNSKLLAIVVFISFLLLPVISFSFDGINTDKPIAAGDAVLKECRGIKDEKTQIDCVAKALETVARNITHRGPGYQHIARTLRNTAGEVRKKKTRKEAAAVIQKTSADFKAAHEKPSLYAGPKPTAQKHFAKFASFTDRARSVLRS
ncbi:MAG: hypothetical protein R3D32_02575 [Nitratireductor sp.]